MRWAVLGFLVVLLVLILLGCSGRDTYRCDPMEIPSDDCPMEDSSAKDSPSPHPPTLRVEEI